MLALYFWSSLALATTKFDPKPSACSFAQLMTQVARQHEGAPAMNTFLVAENRPHPDHEYWVYWPQLRKILLVAWPVSDCEHPNLSVRKELDLVKDVVKTRDEVGSSTYLETETWVADVIFDAARSGYQVTFKK